MPLPYLSALLSLPLLSSWPFSNCGVSLVLSGGQFCTLPCILRLDLAVLRGAASSGVMCAKP